MAGANRTLPGGEQVSPARLFLPAAAAAAVSSCAPPSAAAAAVDDGIAQWLAAAVAGNTSGSCADLVADVAGAWACPSLFMLSAPPTRSALDLKPVAEEQLRGDDPEATDLLKTAAIANMQELKLAIDCFDQPSNYTQIHGSTQTTYRSASTLSLLYLRMLQQTPVQFESSEVQCLAWYHLHLQNTCSEHAQNHSYSAV